MEAFLHTETGLTLTLKIKEHSKCKSVEEKQGAENSGCLDVHVERRKETTVYRNIESVSNTVDKSHLPQALLSTSLQTRTR
jgi:hypothetical protein